jgi:hypothetical protein
MRLLKKAKCTLTLGGPDSGWLPNGAAPYSTNEQKLLLEIRSSADGYFLVSTPEAGGASADTWHRSLEEAMSQAEYQFGVPASAWQEVAA